MKQGRRVSIFVSIFLIGSLLGCATQHHRHSFSLPDENAELVSFKPGLEPDGFGGIKWETELSTLEGMTSYRRDPSHGGIEFYTKERETLKLGKENIGAIQYGFWKGKFYVGVITTQGNSSWNALKEAVIGQYGEGAKPFPDKEEFLWVGKDVVMALRYDDISKRGIYYIRSDSMKQRMEPGIIP